MGQVIALSGWKGAGKDFAAEYLRDTYGFQRLALADVLKDMVAEMFNIPRDSCDDRILKERSLLTLPARPVDSFSDTVHSVLRTELIEGYWTPRALCILLGSLCRSVDPDYWVRRIASTINKNPGTNYVITDVRYRNEVRVLQEVVPGVIVARVDRGEKPLTTDASENDLNDFQFGIRLDNTGSATQYYRQLDRLVDNGNMGRLPDGSILQYGE